ncbi:DUF4142 domain-containing protein [Hymenobacter caeli]|uniref:Membrane protein n=1 Tax=Hymenobacter caeli TaxID=2735894 RepID=A0ABX2FSK1_9BACT|nr:DUF4142 domain-containing protein [Hymenobacter caeli]NRT20168.1 putative membrane protein [Hymenobacter caeli]
MKKIALPALLVAGMLFGTSCSSKPDSTATAKDVNDQKVDNGTVATAAGSKTDTKDVTDYMVDLANTGRTEFELSQAAATRATSPAVKQYATQTVSTHAKDEAAMKDEAAKRNITLPPTLNADSQDMLAKLQGEKAGADFDKKYLNDMADVNDKAISKAQDLIKNSQDPALKTYVQKMVDDDQKHMAEAKQLLSAMK